jgi:hypothetical protein
VGAVAAGSPQARVQVGQDFECGNDAVFDVVNITSVDPENVYPDEIGALAMLVGGAGPPQTYLIEDFETSSGWSSAGNGEWQRGTPQGLGGGSSLPGFEPNPDPSSAYEGNNAMGNDLTGLGEFDGNYEHDVSSTYTSPVLDSSDSIETELSFAKYLNVAPNDLAFVEVTPGDGTWGRIYETSEDLDAAWTLKSFDVSAWADRNALFRVRFGIESDATATTSGWNVDDLRLTGVTSSSCEPVSRGVSGAVDGLSVTRESGGQLTLSWNADCGAGSHYGVYRGDLAAGYGSLAPEPGLCSIDGTSVAIAEGTGRADFFLVVPNDGAFDGGYGRDAEGEQRAPAAQPCYQQDQIDACAP